MNRELPAFEPVYLMSNPNEPIILYEGEMEILDTHYPARGIGTLTFTWFPSTGVELEMDITSPDFNPLLTEGFSAWIESCFSGETKQEESNREVKLLEIDIANPIIYIENITSSKASGELIKTQKLASPSVKVQYALFHLVNFSNYNPSSSITLKGEIWQIDIKPIESLAQHKKHLETYGGYIITHVAKLERCDGESFSSDEITDLLEAVFYFLSFSRGAWVSPILPIGFDANGNQVWQEWCLWKASSWGKAFRSGSSNEYAPYFYNTFSGFLGKWCDAKYKEPLRIAIDWYIESNGRGVNIEGSVILAQAGLELLASLILKEDKGIIDASTEPPARDALGILIYQAGISLEIPDEISDLKRIAKEQEQTWDGPKAITKLRNCFTHPTPKNRELLDRFEFAERVDALRLGLWYLEVVLLRFFGCQEDEIGKFIDFFRQ